MYMYSADVVVHVASTWNDSKVVVTCIPVLNLQAGACRIGVLAKFSTCTGTLGVPGTYM